MLKQVTLVLLSAAICLVYIHPACSANVNSGSVPEYNNWFYPFYQRSCVGCPRAGNILPWCVKVPAVNLFCPSAVQGKPIVTLSCLRITGSQVIGSVSRAARAAVADALVADAEVPASTITCKGSDPTVRLPSCFKITASDSFPDGLPAGVSVPAASISGTLDPSSVSVSVSSLDCSPGTPALPSCATIQGSQVIGFVPSATFAISASSSTNSTSANYLQCPADAAPYSVPLPSCYAISSSQITGSINASQLSGALGSGVTLAGTQVTGTINATQLSGTLGSGVNVDGSQIVDGTIGSGVAFDGTLTGSGSQCGSLISNCLNGQLIPKYPTCTGNSIAIVQCDAGHTPASGCVNSVDVGIVLNASCSVGSFFVNMTVAGSCEYYCSNGGALSCDNGKAYALPLWCWGENG